MKIDLTSESAAFSYLRSLDPSTIIELPGAYEAKPHGAVADAVAVITGEPPNAWATSMGRWEWTAGEIIAALDRQPKPNKQMKIQNTAAAEWAKKEVANDPDGNRESDLAELESAYEAIFGERFPDDSDREEDAEPRGYSMWSDIRSALDI